MADKSNRSRSRLALIIALSLVALLIAVPVVAFFVMQNRIDDRIERFEDPFAGREDRDSAEGDESDDDEDDADADSDVDDPVNILVLGSDSRISAGDPSQWEAGGQRTDAIMIAQVSGDRESMTFMSIPRDSWVPIPGHPDAKINAAFSWGGPSLMIETVEDLTGITLDHIMVTDFESFQAITDELGGVELTLTEPLRSGGTDLPAGTHRLNGSQALDYTRQRHGLSGGDLSRMQRQQNWMRAMMVSAFNREVLTNPGRLNDLLIVVAENVAVDEHFQISHMRNLALSMRNIRPGDVNFISAPVTGLGRSPDGAQSIVQLDFEALDQVSQAFIEDRAAEFVAENEDLVQLGDLVE
ncbi:LCP family protein [Pseudactinotalea sp. Z1732]|uniref:LCP family protein n=2 Tax=Micrococcales TaxID=85006 RepID=UPI003C7EA6BF